MVRIAARGGSPGCGRQVPEVATLAYRWRAYDYETRQRRPLYEPIGGFWVGCSIEGLLALGTVRFFERGRVETTINGARYQIELYRSPDGRSLRTFFPRFLGPRMSSSVSRLSRSAAGL